MSLLITHGASRGQADPISTPSSTADILRESTFENVISDGSAASHLDTAPDVIFESAKLALQAIHSFPCVTSSLMHCTMHLCTVIWVLATNATRAKVTSRL